MGKLHYEYEDEWVAAGYRRAMGSGKVLRPPSSNVIRVYRFLAADHAISSIAFQRIKVSKIGDVNDPYEFLAFKTVGPHRLLLSAIKDEANKKQRLLCFSADWTSPVLWAHYGDVHRGICLGFNLLRSSAKKVQYTADRVLLPQARTPLNDQAKADIADRLVTTKCDHWVHEEEIRALVSLERTRCEGTLDFLYFDEALELAEVVVGFQCSIAFEELQAFVRDKHPLVPVFRTRIAKQYFRMVPDEDTIP